MEELQPEEIKLKRINSAQCGIRHVPRGGCTRAATVHPSSSHSARHETTPSVPLSLSSLGSSSPRLSAVRSSPCTMTESSSAHFRATNAPLVVAVDSRGDIKRAKYFPTRIPLMLRMPRKPEQRACYAVVKSS